MTGNELVDAPFSIPTTSPDLAESPDKSACDPGSLFVLVGCVFSMMHTFLTIKLYPAFAKLTTTRLMQGFLYDLFVVIVCHCVSH